MLRQRFKAVVGVSVPTVREQPFLFLTALGGCLLSALM